jgi:hypothetical protein
MKRTALVIAALTLITLVGCKAEPGRSADADQGGSIGGVEQGTGQGSTGQGTPGRPSGGQPETTPAPGADTSAVDRDLDEIADLLDETDAELRGAEETPPDSD